MGRAREAPGVRDFRDRPIEAVLELGKRSAWYDDALYEYAYFLETTGKISKPMLGDWKADGWTNGAPMQKDAAFWKAFVELPWGSQVQYKFVIDGTNWVLDPANPDQAGSPPNSLLKNVQCGWWSCGAPANGYDWHDAVLYFAFVDRFLDGDSTNTDSAMARAPLKSPTA